MPTPLLRRLTAAVGMLSILPAISIATATVAAAEPNETAPAHPSAVTEAADGATESAVAPERLRAALVGVAAARAASGGMPSWFVGPRVAGVDVSAYNTAVSWSAHRSKGVAFAWIKATEGQTWRSSRFSSQYSSAHTHGVLRGAYHFARPNSSSGTSQARFFVKNGGAWRADGHTLPGALDMEMPPKGNQCYGKTPAQMRAWITGFTSEYRRLTGRNAIIYTTNYWWRTCTANSKAFSTTNRLWLARYASTPGTLPGGWAYPSVWQYSASGGLDKNMWFGSSGALKAWARG